jgi:hypothetical protein
MVFSNSIADFRRRSGGRNEIVFSGGMYVRKNTYQATKCASVSRKRVREVDCKLFVEKRQHRFSTVRHSPPQILCGGE